MTDRALWNATAKRDRLQSKIQTLEQALTKRRAALESVSAWITAYHEFSGMAPAAGSGTSSEHSAHKIGGEPTEADDASGAERRRTVGNPRKEDVAAAARKLIEEAGEPISRADLYKALAERGVVIAGRDPEQVLSTMLWRTQKQGGSVVRLKSGGYWLADRPTPDGDNVPSSPSSDVIHDATREVAIVNVIHDFLMRCEIQELKNIEAAIDFGESLPDYVTNHLNSKFPDLFGKEDLTGRDFLFTFISALNSRLHAFERSTDRRPA